MIFLKDTTGILRHDRQYADHQLSLALTQQLNHTLQFFRCYGPRWEVGLGSRADLQQRLIDGSSAGAVEDGAVCSGSEQQLDKRRRISYDATLDRCAYGGITVFVTAVWISPMRQRLRISRRRFCIP